MANNELTVIRADGTTKTLKSEDLGGVHVQGTYVAELLESPVNPSGGLTRYSIDSSPVVALDPPSASYRYARVRVYETPAPTTTVASHRLYYRTDGTAPLNTGGNVFGFLMHGESILVRLANAANFQMVADVTDNGTFEVYVEWLSTPAS